MKIEKVNEHQIRCTLTREDLANRELKISELAYGTEKAKSLFRDMMRQAAFECGFEAEDIPLMIEAIPLSSECIVLIITKVEDPEELDTRFSKFAPSVHEDDSYDEDSDDLADVFSDGDDEVLNMLRKMSGSGTSEISAKSALSASGESTQRTAVKENSPAQPSSRLFSFATLHDVTRLAHVAAASYKGMNTLYKDEAAGSYLLLVNADKQSASDFNRICNLISEYGRPEKAALSAKAYLEEHYEPLIKDHAIESLAQI
ncbi:MAG: adaptor protein MecA [Lachnospiraceae bacterium]|nr:adaptor protein MecA [Lachnospiraceae bacterium]